MRSIRGRDCNVAVVGGAGFLGSHLVDYLIEQRQCSVLVIDNLITGRKTFIHDAAKFEWADITQSENHIRKLFLNNGIEYVFNYAAMPYIPVSFERPLLVSDVNFMGALKVMNAAQESGAKGILQVSSAEIYGEGQLSFTDAAGVEDFENNPPKFTRIDEDGEVKPHSTYGAAKAAIDSLIQVRWKEAKTPCISLRQFNCVGERETHPYIVPEIISQLYRQSVNYPRAELDCICELNASSGREAVVQLGNNSFRDFQYAGDAVRMAVDLLEQGSFGDVYNMGSEGGIKMYALAEMIGRLMGFQKTTVAQDPARVRPWEIWHLQSDNTKLYGTIKARPIIDLENALKSTIEYFLSQNGNWGW